VKERISLQIPPHKRTKIKVFQATKKLNVIPMTHRQAGLNIELQSVLLLLQDNYFNFQFLETLNTANRRRKRNSCVHNFNDIELPGALGVREKLHLV
jgi:hypothetical protein